MLLAVSLRIYDSMCLLSSKLGYSTPHYCLCLWAAGEVQHSDHESNLFANVSDRSVSSCFLCLDLQSSLNDLKEVVHRCTSITALMELSGAKGLYTTIDFRKRLDVLTQFDIVTRLSVGPFGIRSRREADVRDLFSSLERHPFEVDATLTQLRHHPHLFCHMRHTVILFCSYRLILVFLLLQSYRRGPTLGRGPVPTWWGLRVGSDQAQPAFRGDDPVALR